MNEFPPTILSVLENIRNYPEENGKAWVGDEDQAQILSMILLSPSNRYHSRLWESHTVANYRGVLKNVLLDEMRGTTGPTEAEQIIGLSRGKDCLALSQGLLPRSAYDAKKELAEIKKEKKKIEQKIESIKEQYRKQDRPIYGQIRPKKRINPYAPKAPSVRLVDEPKPIDAPKPSIITRLEVKLEFWVSQEEEALKKLGKYHSTDLGKPPEMDRIPSEAGLCNPTTHRSGGNQIHFSFSFKSNPEATILSSERVDMVRVVQESVCRQSKKYESEFRFIVDNLSGRIKTEEGKSPTRQQSADMLGITLAQYVGRVRLFEIEFKREWARREMA